MATPLFMSPIEDTYNTYLFIQTNFLFGEALQSISASLDFYSTLSPCKNAGTLPYV